MNRNGEIIKVVVVDDHALIREAVRTLLAENERIALVGEGSVGDDVLPLVEKHQPDVLLLDISMPQSANDPDKESFSIVPALKALRDKHKKTKVIILSQYLQGGLVRPSVRSYINGYLLKSDDLSLKLAEAVEAVSLGAVYFSHAVNRAATRVSTREITLTDRQKDILLAIAQDPEAPYKKVAQEMCITERTVKWHLTGAYRKLGVNNIRAAMLACIEHDLIPEVVQSGLDLSMYGTTDGLT
jgi:DNA-binding NarL/FixJ family response regulator